MAANRPGRGTGTPVRSTKVVTQTSMQGPFRAVPMSLLGSARAEGDLRSRVKASPLERLRIARVLLGGGSGT
jgi:hypothetical protein